MTMLLDVCGIQNPRAFKLGFQWISPHLAAYKGSPVLKAFFFSGSRLSHDRLALSGAGDKKPDALHWNHGAVALCERLQKTGKQLRLACGSRYERLIAESHHLVDSSLRMAIRVGQLLVVPATR